MTNLPSATVIFLFTDIEGSTRLAHQHPAVWETARARHHAILGGAIEAHNGYVFQIIGDAFCAAFSIAGDAMHAAMAAQIALRAEAWGDAIVRVRMGIHTGSATLQANGEYHGYLTMSRVQRLMSAGHGGQVLLSQATQELVCDELPDGVGLRDMGQRRLKDLIRPERIYQLVIADLPSDFPPLKTLDTYRHNLPAQLTSFIGREMELVEIKQAVRDHRLVTLTGSGGTGKTRLSLQAAADLLDQFPDGVWFIELAALNDSDLVPQAILGVMRIDEQPGKAARNTLIDALDGKHSLLILDNCEHLIEACAQLAVDLLSNAPALRILASSREALGVKGERAWYVPSFSVPNIKRLPELEQLAQYEAVRLFVDRATLAQPRFTLTAANAAAVAQICARLDGIPLAIELAASRVKVLSVEQIAARLDDRFRLLTGGSRASLPRQQTLRALIDWSVNLLSEQEKTLFRRLAVFSGGWMIEAAEEVCALETEDPDVLDLSVHLVDKSLIIARDTPDGVRFRRLETIRQYAREMLLASGETRQLRDRHLAYFLAFAEEAEIALRGPQQAVGMARLAREHDNLNAALDWSLDAKPDLGLRLAAALVDYWDTRGHFSEARKWLEAVLTATTELAPTPARVQAIYGAMGLAARQGDVARWKTLLEEGFALAQALGYKQGIALGMHARGIIAMLLENDDDQAESLFSQALAIRRDIGEALGIGQALGPLASCALKGFEYARAEELFGESLALFRVVGHQREVAGALGNLADVALWRRDYASARARAHESLVLYRELEDKHGIATALRSLSRALHNQGDIEEARTASQQSIAIFRELEDRTCLAESLPVLARQLHALGYLQSAAQLAQESATLLHEVGDKVSASGALDVLGRIALAQGSVSAARQHFLDGLALQQEMKDVQQVPSLLEGVALQFVITSRLHDAVRLLGAADALREKISLARLEVERPEFEHAIADAWKQLGEASFHATWEEGQAMTADQARSLAAKENQ